MRRRRPHRASARQDVVPRLAVGSARRGGERRSPRKEIAKTTFSIPWIQDLAGQADSFDEDHFRLLDKVNALLQAIAFGDETEVLMAFRSLRVAAQEHFAKEEAKMDALQYPLAEQHRESHRRLLHSLSSVQFMLSNTKGFASNTGPFALLEQWFDAHLSNDDRKLADFLAGQGPAMAEAESGAGPVGRETCQSNPAGA